MRRRAVLAAMAGAAACGSALERSRRSKSASSQGGAHLAGVAGLREALAAARLTDVGVLVRRERAIFASSKRRPRELEQGGVNVIVAFAVSVALAAQRSTS